MAERPVDPDELDALVALFAPEHVSDPYPAYRQWREQRPVARPHERLFVLSRFADCEAVLADASFGHEDGDDPSPLRPRPPRRPGEIDARSFLGMNPPDHTRLRRLVSHSFTPARVRALTPDVEAIVEDLLDDLGSHEATFDLIERLALPLPVRVISELLGIPTADRARLVFWSTALTRGLDPGFLVSGDERGRQLEARDRFAAYLRDLLSARRRSPGEDLISALVQVHEGDDVLSEEEVIGVCMLLLVGGHETTRSLIGSAVLTLLRHPEQLAMLHAQPELVERAVEELLRYDPPVQLIVRSARRDTEVAGIEVPAGAFVLLLLGAANRDETVFEHPDRFEVDRGARRHLAFGHGIHYCLGAPLARLEATVALRGLLPKLPRLQISGPPEWKPHTVLRGLQHLWLQDAERAPARVETSVED